MIYEYAVEPAVLNNWQDFRYVYDQVGIEHGRLISNFPSTWAKMVITACADNSQLRDIDRTRLVEKLKSLRMNKMVKMNRPYDPGRNWLANADIEHRRCPFRAVLSRSTESSIPNLLNFDDLDADHSLWYVPKDRVVPRKAQELACCARLLLQISREIIVADPHFDPGKPRFLETLSHLLQYSFEEHPPKRIELHVEYDYWKEQQRERDWMEEAAQSLPRLIPEGFALKVFRWESRLTGDKPHARYILTERGGIRYDYGIDEWKGEGQTTDVSLLSEDLYRRRWADYQVGTAAYTLIDDPVEIHGAGKRLEADPLTT